MKIEFIKETNAKGTIFYYTIVNGAYEPSSLSCDYSQAYEYFISLKKRQEPIIEVLEHYSIDTLTKKTNEPN